MSSTPARSQTQGVLSRPEAATTSAGARPPTLTDPSLGRRATADGAARLGFWSGMLAAAFSLLFSIASVPVLLGAFQPPWVDVLTLVPSLLLAPSLLVLLVCLDTATPASDKLWSRLSVAFASIYVSLVSVVYVVELAVVEPLLVSGQANRAGLLSIEPGGVLNAIDGLGYTFLGLALVFAAPVFRGSGLNRWTRWSLIANGVAVVPVVLTYFTDRVFLLIAGPIWTIAIPAAAILIAWSFRGPDRVTDCRQSSNVMRRIG